MEPNQWQIIDAAGGPGGPLNTAGTAGADGPSLSVPLVRGGCPNGRFLLFRRSQHTRHRGRPAHDPNPGTPGPRPNLPGRGRAPSQTRTRVALALKSNLRRALQLLDCGPLELYRVPSTNPMCVACRSRRSPCRRLDLLSLSRPSIQSRASSSPPRSLRWRRPVRTRSKLRILSLR
jgi:hypothetical protein